VKIVVLEESNKRKSKLQEMLQDKGHEVTSCSATSEFMELLEMSEPDKIVMNVEAWQHGNAIFSYFNFVKRLETIPIVFYNASENFSNITNRTHIENDKILNSPIDIDSILQEVE
jgi:two-component SAPR family response regulator